ncbi:taste receptor type 1 member 2 isoform X1 [Fukomys damarensis]|uniref:taste receptor type 1 member 2 isoform X1 n=1 Tax=Fukomys damarensis TaxID=885580 RepID=UPI00053FDB4B|nr:taste receptor type 1 member 2 isoform X1 [Fukomys damarensis]
MGLQTRMPWAPFLLLQVLAGKAEKAENLDFFLPGDYLLGGLFTLHANPQGVSHLTVLQVPKCQEYDMKVLGYSLMQAMRFAVEEINNHSSLLPGVQLGYEIVDICYQTNNVQPVLYFLAKTDYFLPINRDYSNYVPRVVAVIGPDNSKSTITVANFLSLFLLPQISYSAVSDQLRNKQRYPAMLRTMPSATHHIEAMVQLMLHFHWNWIAVLMSDDDYGRDNSQLLRDRLTRNNDICIAFQEVLPTPQPEQVVTAAELRQLEDILLKLKQATARIVVVFSPELALHNFFHQVLFWNVTDMVWIASESWAIDPVLHNLTGLRNTGTFLGVTIQEVPMPGFSEFRVRRPRTPPAQPPNRSSPRGTCNQECDACLNITRSFNTILTLSGERVAYCVYSAVYAVAHALHSLLHCGPLYCTKKAVYPWQLLKEIQKVNFPLLGNQIFFDEQGDVPLRLDIVQWQWYQSQNPFQSVASFDPVRQQLKVIGNISWHTHDNRIPTSMCSKKCQVGQIKKSVGIHPCCFECNDCLPGTFLNQTADEYECQPCPSTMWSNRKDTSCFKRKLAFLEWHEAPTITVAVLAVLGFLSTLAALVIFWRHFQTPMVRSAGGPMCFLMLMPLLVAFGMLPVYVGPPTVLTCVCRQAFFTLCYSVCISCITVRSFQIVCIFRIASYLPRAYGFWVRYHGPYVSVAVITALKAMLVASNMMTTTINPMGHPDPEDPNIMILSCHPNYRTGLLLNSSMDLFLSMVGFVFAYLGKELPTNYNEAKFITLSMTFSFTSSISLCTFMSVYNGVLVTIMDFLVTVLNFLAISLGYFGPKCYMILFYPERNTAAYFNSMIQGYTMRKD